MKWVTLIHLIVALIKNILLYKNELASILRYSKNKIKVELDLFNYATEYDLINLTGVDTLQFTKKDNLAESNSDFYKLDINDLEKVPSGLNSFKSKIEGLGVDKLAPLPTYLRKLSNAVQHDFVKKMYMRLRSKILKMK